jgi:NIPSNAP
MLKWKIAAFVGLACGVAGVGWGYAQQRQQTGFLELRVYTALPGKRDALAARFANRTAAIYARHGITNVGYWIPQTSDAEIGVNEGRTFIYMRGYPSREERDKRLKAAHDDPEFTEVVRNQERSPDTKLIERVDSVDLVPNTTRYTAITITP